VDQVNDTQIQQRLTKWFRWTFGLSHSHRGFSPVIGTGLYSCGTVLTVFTRRNTRKPLKRLLGSETPLIHRAEAAV
jgi:hypothetical protein